MKGERNISLMTLSDLDDVCRIEAEVFPNPWPRRAFESDIRNDSTYCMVVRDLSERVMAYACLMIVADEAHLTNIAVSPDCRRQGMGSVLMDHLISLAEREGSRAMFLEVRSSNIGAIRFYCRYGFVELYRRRSYYRRPTEDALVMVRTVGERNSNG